MGQMSTCDESASLRVQQVSSNSIIFIANVCAQAQVGREIGSGEVFGRAPKAFTALFTEIQESHHPPRTSGGSCGGGGGDGCGGSGGGGGASEHCFFLVVRVGSGGSGGGGGGGGAGGGCDRRGDDGGGGDDGSSGDDGDGCGSVSCGDGGGGGYGPRFNMVVLLVLLRCCSLVVDWSQSSNQPTNCTVVVAVADFGGHCVVSLCFVVVCFVVLVLLDIVLAIPVINAVARC